jgi:polyhydroxybutyrate depolymerase
MKIYSEIPSMRPLKTLALILIRTVFVGLALALLVVLVGAFAFQRANRTNGSLVSSGGERRYLLYVPQSYAPAAPTPLVISIHGYAEWPAHQLDITRWNDHAEQHGFLVVYPEGTRFPRRWRLTGQADTPSDPMLDVQFISDLIDHLAQEYNLDRSRIYANGLSNGGGMSVVLACNLADRIAAVGSVSGAQLFPAQQCQPSRPVPLIAFHGTEDTIVPYTGGPSRAFDLPFPVVADWIGDWAEQNGCSPTPVELPCQGEVCEVRYTGCAQEAEVVFYTINGGGHSWPGGEPIPAWIVGHTTEDIDATAVMWEFFSRYAIEP